MMDMNVAIDFREGHVIASMVVDYEVKSACVPVGMCDLSEDVARALEALAQQVRHE